LELFSLNFTQLTLVLAGVSLLAAILLLILLLPRLNRIRACATSDNRNNVESTEDNTSYPDISVIITSSNDSANLPVLLPQILEQDYPGAIEVIVVDDGDDGSTETVVSQLQTLYSNLYMTHVPPNSRNLSRKKMALTLGVKAARYDYLMFTCGHCRVRSARWLKLMARHFTTGAGIVAGYSTPMPATDEAAAAPHRRLRAFDTVHSACQWLGAAIGGHPYRADGNNLAYSRHLFLDCRGFADTLNLVNGDDDIFVSQLATKAQLAVELADDSIIENLQHAPVKQSRNEREARRFTARFLRKATPRLWGFMSILWWLWAAAGIAAILTGLPSLVPLIAITVIALGLCIPVELSWRKTSTTLLSRPLCLTVVWFLLTHPLLTAIRKMRRSDVKHYSWQ